jgi:hypothetical protein
MEENKKATKRNNVRRRIRTSAKTRDRMRMRSREKERGKIWKKSEGEKEK